MPKSNRPAARGKPAKPYEGFPLFAHPSGQWAKKIRKSLKYFGSWRVDPEGTAALKLFNQEWPYLKEGRTPPAVDLSEGVTLKKLCNLFLRSKEDKLNAGDLSPRTFRDYFKTCQGLIEQFGKDRRVDDLRPDDFSDYRKKLNKRLGVVSLKNEINRVSILFNFAFPVGGKNQHKPRYIDKPVVFGEAFDRPSARAQRKERNEAGAKLFTREEVLMILKAAPPVLRAMTLLGLNCGFGNTDVSSLPQSAVNLTTGWVTFPRPKTEIPRRVPLWTETVEALRAAIAVRPAPAETADKGLCFLTRLGRPWVRVKLKKQADKQEQTDSTEEAGPEVTVPIDALSPEFKKLLTKLHINGRRGLGFYTLRHCFETIGGESKDQVAVDAIMGHVDPSMAANYRHGVSDERLKAVTDTVRRWLFTPALEVKKEGGVA